MGERNSNKRRNDKLSLYLLKFEGAVKDLLKVKPEIKEKDTTKRVVMIKESEK